MASIKNNLVIAQLRNLLKSAINLKEKFNTGASEEVIHASWEAYESRLEELKRICPSQVLNQGLLLRHSSWLARRISEWNPDACYKDIWDICHTDIFYVEECYLHYLVDTGDAQEKNYEWDHLHPAIIEIAKGRFQASHYADAVFTSYLHINTTVKAKYKELTGREEDGVKLMRFAFGMPKPGDKPKISLADYTSESGWNIQDGYMQIFAGAMQGIRNPKAHAILDVNPDEAWEMIVLASHLMRMWDKFNN